MCKLRPHSQVNVVYTAHNHSHIVSVGFTMCTVNNILRLQTLYSNKDEFPWKKNGQVAFKNVCTSTATSQLLNIDIGTERQACFWSIYVFIMSFYQKAIRDNIKINRDISLLIIMQETSFCSIFYSKMSHKNVAWRGRYQGESLDIFTFSGWHLLLMISKQTRASEGWDGARD